MGVGKANAAGPRKRFVQRIDGLTIGYRRLGDAAKVYGKNVFQLVEFHLHLIDILSGMGNNLSPIGFKKE